MGFEERGLEAMVTFIYLDCKAPKNNFRLGFMLRVSESINIVGTILQFLRQVTPHFKSTAEIVINKITQLPSQDFFCVPQEVANSHLEHWNHIHTTLARWFRQIHYAVKDTSCITMCLFLVAAVAETN